MGSGAVETKNDNAIENATNDDVFGVKVIGDVDETARFEIMKKTDSLFNYQLSKRGEEVNGCCHLNVDFGDTENKEDIEVIKLDTNLINVDHTNPKIYFNPRIEARNFSMVDPNFVIPNPPRTPTGFFLMGSGGGADPYHIMGSNFSNFQVEKVRKVQRKLNI